IPPGVDFVEMLEEEVGSCEVLLAVIGPGWVDAKDELGRRRLERPDDFVRIEIAAALRRKIPVVPVLVNGAHMPDAASLPDDLKPLARRQATILSHDRFRSDVEHLIRKLVLRPHGKDVAVSAGQMQTWAERESLEIYVIAFLSVGKPARLPINQEPEL